jgi:peroxiredoxin
LNNKTLIVLSTALAVMVVLFHLSVKKQPSDDEASMFDSMSNQFKWQDRPAPDFSVEFLNGEKFTLSDQVGRKVFILNFFATSCDPCTEEMPELVRYFEKHKNEPFLMIGIDADEPESAVLDFVRDHGVTYPVSIDRGGELQKAFSVRSLPTTVFIGADGLVQTYEVGQIRNADIAFDLLLNTGLAAVQTGTGITKEAFLALSSSQSMTGR